MLHVSVLEPEKQQQTSVHEIDAGIQVIVSRLTEISTLILSYQCFCVDLKQPH